MQDMKLVEFLEKKEGMTNIIITLKQSLRTNISETYTEEEMNL
jgi:hypothetical protein